MAAFNFFSYRSKQVYNITYTHWCHKLEKIALWLRKLLQSTNLLFILLLSGTFLCLASPPHPKTFFGILSLDETLLLVAPHQRMLDVVMAKVASHAHLIAGRHCVLLLFSHRMELSFGWFRLLVDDGRTEVALRSANAALLKQSRARPKPFNRRFGGTDPCQALLGHRRWADFWAKPLWLSRQRAVGWLFIA